jgi:Zn-dependent protease with chaperone function
MNGRAVPRVYPTGGDGRWLRAASVAALGLIALLLAACAGPTSSPSPSPSPRSDAGASRPSAKAIDPAQVERLQRLWVPLLTAMNHPLQPNQVKIGLMDEPHINAANAGGGEFFVTSGLLQKANDDQLQAILAHETAHEDLGHVAKSQALGTGLNIGMVILDQIIPGTGALTPIAGQLISNAYGRNEEYAADKHGVDLLRRIGKPKEQMIDALTWLTQVEGNSPGGFFATHPAPGDRIEALRQMK